jgi:UDP-glucose 4-epimerase
MRSLVIGGAGFIGSHLVDRLVSLGPVTVFDDLSNGHLSFLGDHVERGRVRFVRGDARVLAEIVSIARDHELVVHLAANPEARRGLVDTRLDLELGTIAAYNALEAARLAGARRFVFASSGTVYGETPQRCAEGDLGELPISLYGASKLAGEALVSAYAASFGLRGLIVRFGNVVGPRGTHGAALDFLRQLAVSPDELRVLGDGHQAKPYLHVHDCVDAIVHLVRTLDENVPAIARDRDDVDIVNIAPASTTTVRQIAELCVRHSPSPHARIHYVGGERGWPGDIPRSQMNGEKLARLGFALRHSSDEAVARSVAELAREVFPPGKPATS